MGLFYHAAAASARLERCAAWCQPSRAGCFQSANVDLAGDEEREKQVALSGEHLVPSLHHFNLLQQRVNKRAKARL
ncbi:hypothetical protein WME97_43455 [Sorangium sp. So ce367]|uniref:hypothetical protein n=1 Tax=Sorangium sp. So ce367 TaxID=3133305 RepID=UPI003F647C78